MEILIPKLPNLDLTHYRFILNNPKTPEYHEEAKIKLLNAIEENSEMMLFTFFFFFFYILAFPHIRSKIEMQIWLPSTN